MIKVTTDFDQLALRFAIDYWYLLLLFILFVIGLILLSNRISKSGKNLKEFSVSVRIIIPFIIVGLSILAYRGGTQLKPIGLITAGKYTTPENFPLLLNSTFTLIKTAQKPELAEYQFMTEKEMFTITEPVKHYKGTSEKLNVVLVILESFSKEYIGSINGLGVTYTPFLDSLINVGLLIENTFANGKISMEGIPAITAGIPSLMDEPYISSPYASNQITSIANLLDNHGYTTSFYHGGTNGTLGLDAFAKMAGYQVYKGRNEYENDKDFDGKWGIFDEPYLQYYAEELGKAKAPFFSTVFTLSSHHPYTIPKIHKDKFKGGPIEILKAIQYTDYSLGKFFNKIKNQEFFKNTLFIITADHTGEAFSPYYLTRPGSYQIPLLYFCPSLNLKGRLPVISQQTDILPSIMHLLKFDKPFFSLGKSSFEEGDHYALNYLPGSYQFIQNDKVVYFDGKNVTGIFALKDTTQANNLYPQEKDSIVKNSKAYIQLFNYSMIKNKMTANEK
jgi:phosphoglycerol transferase MdoB-like AlkP superfamily enzyme